MVRRDIFGPWEQVRRLLACSGGGLLVLAGGALGGERDPAYLLLGTAPFLVVFTASLAWLLARWARAPEDPVPPSVLDAARERFEPRHPDGVTGARHGVQD